MPHTEVPLESCESSPDSPLSADELPQLIRPSSPPLPIQQNRVNLALRRISSYDRDIAQHEEDNHWPGQAYLLPVVLPQVTEPTLDELLRRVTGQNDLQNVDSVKLRVISYMVSLSRLSVFLPRLSHLDLDGSVLNSLRDLGCGLIHLTHLNVSNCGLSSFDGTVGLPMVEVLIADDNMVQLVGPLANLTLLKKLSMKNNRVSDLGMLTFLGMCPNLIELEMQGNPVINLILYRTTMQRNVRTLELLDGVSFNVDNDGASVATAICETNSTTEAESSLSDLSESLGTISIASESGSRSVKERPATSNGLGVCAVSVITISDRRPASGSAIPSSSQLGRPGRSLSLGTPVAGTVLNLVRQRKRAQTNAWDTSSSSSSGSATSSRSEEISNYKKGPPQILPPLKSSSHNWEHLADEESSSSQSSSSSLRQLREAWRVETEKTRRKI